MVQRDAADCTWRLHMETVHGAIQPFEFRNDFNVFGITAAA